MSLYRWFFLILSTGSLVACSKGEERTQARISQITESVYSSVIVQPDSLYKAYAPVNGILENNFIEEGDVVSRGTVLHQVINTNTRLNAENARLSMELAQNNLSGSTALLNSIREEIQAAKLSLANDSINYFRQKNLWEQQIGSQVEYDSKKLAFELSKNNLHLLYDKYDRTQNELQTQLKQAKNNYLTSMTSSNDFRVESRIDGKVYAVYKNPGEIVSPMEPLSLIGSTSVFIIEMLVDEVDIVKISTSQKVIVILDAYSDQTFTAIVHKIYPKKDERNQTFIVEALFESPPPVLYPGLAGEANIVIAHKKEALIIPREFIINQHYVRTENGLEAIEVGLQNIDSAEIRSGISKDTWIYKPKDD